jgi:hypothetical protein
LERRVVERETVAEQLIELGPNRVAVCSGFDKHVRGQ